MIYHVARDPETKRRVLFVRANEAKKLDPHFESIDVPTDKAGLQAFVQGLFTELDTTEACPPLDSHVEQVPFNAPFEEPTQVSDAPPPTPKPTQPSNEGLRLTVTERIKRMEVEEIVEKILESKGPHFARYLLAGVERLGFLGKAGWDHVHAFLKLHEKAPNMVDRGLTMLVLMQLEALNAPTPQRGKIAPVKEAA